MQCSTRGKWIAITLVAVIVPISLLTTFKLTGIIPEPQTPETITLEPINWEMERPIYTVEIGEKIKNTYINDETAIEMSIQVHGYREEALSSPFFGNDGISFSVIVNVTQGHILSSMIKYYPLDVNTAVLMDISDWALVLRNATVTGMNIVGTNSSEAYVALKVPNSPCRIESLAHWVFGDKNVETHQLHAEVEVTCFSGSAYEKIVTPIYLKVWAPEAGNNFVTAKTISFGKYLAHLGEMRDGDDYYALWAQEGHIISVQMTYPDPYCLMDPDLYLYNFNEELEASSCSTGLGVTEHVTFTANYTGFWYIRVHDLLGEGLYLLEITEVWD